MLGQSPTPEVLMERQSSSKQPLKPMAALPEDEPSLPEGPPRTPQSTADTPIFGMDMPTPFKNQ